MPKLLYESATLIPAIAMTDPASNATEAPAEPRLSWWQAARHWLRRLLRARQETLKEVIEEAIEEHEEQAEEPLAPEEKVMLHNVLSFSDLNVGDIMVPRTDIAAVPMEISLDELKRHLMTQRHTRIPVYEETLDRVQGFIHVKDLLPMLAGDAPFDIRSALRGLLFVPPSMPILDLLVRMRHAGSHMAIVVDEYGGTDGLVTMEDLFEEIVGDIQDEHDRDEEPQEHIARISDKLYEVSARITIEKLERALGLNLVTEERADEFDTLGGLIFFQIGRVPAKGEVIPHISGAKFEIADADARRIRRVRIHTA